MGTNFYPNGLGGTVDLVVTNAPFYGLNSQAWYVHFGTGVDAVAPAGRDKQRPLKTLRQAITNAVAGDVIVLLDGHDETITAVMTVSKTLIIVGCGQTAGVPNVKFRTDAAVTTLLLIQAPSCQLRNIKFEKGVQLNAAARVNIAHTGTVIDGCYFEMGENDSSGIFIDGGSDGTVLRDTTVLSVAQTATTRPTAAITTGGGIAGLTLDGLTLSDGLVGFGNGYAMDLSTAAVTQIRGYRLSLLLGASVKVGANATGFLIPTVTGGGSIDT